MGFHARAIVIMISIIIIIIVIIIVIIIIVIIIIISSSSTIIIARDGLFAPRWERRFDDVAPIVAGIRQSVLRPCRVAGCTYLSNRNLNGERARHGREGSGDVIGGGDDAVGNFHRAQVSQFELFELIPLLKLDTVSCRAIRGNSISVNSTLPPLLGKQERAGGKERKEVCHSYPCPCPSQFVEHI